MNEVEQILADVQASLASHRKAKVDAQDLVAQALALKQQSAANVADGRKDAAHARQLLADHTASIQAKKAARAQARAARRPIEVGFGTDDADGRRLQENAEEADAALVLLQEIDAKHAYQLLKAEGDVVAAETQIYQQYIEGIARKMIEHDSIMRGLHAELSAMVPSENNRPRNMPPPSAVVQKALALVFIDQLHVPVNVLRGEGAALTNGWAERRKALTG